MFLLFLFFKFLFIYFLERGEGKEKERERKISVREIHQLAASQMPLKWGPGPQSRHVS